MSYETATLCYTARTILIILLLVILRNVISLKAECNMQLFVI